MKYLTLDDVCLLNMGQSPDSSTYNEVGEGLPFYQGNADFGERYPQCRIWCSEPTKIAEKEDVLISVRAPIGALNEAREKCCIGRGLAAIRPKGGLNKDFLYYFLLSKKSYLISKGTGSTFKAISKNVLRELTIPVPTLQEQEKQSGILNTLWRVICKRRTQQAKLDELIKCRFVEMFGTYPANEKGWKTGTIRDVIQEARYGASRPAVEGGQYPYLRMNNITYGGDLDLSDTKRINVPEAELPKCTVRRGDVLFNRTNSKELVGKTCVYNRDEMMVLAGFVIRVRVNDSVLPEFLAAFLNAGFSKHMLLNMCKSAIGQANINAQEMQDIEIYIPPISSQQEYVSFKNQIDKFKFACFFFQLITVLQKIIIFFRNFLICFLF
jgi:type I restriction enzyme S subunit